MIVIIIIIGLVNFFCVCLSGFEEGVIARGRVSLW